MAKRVSPDRLAGRIEQVFEDGGDLHLPVTKLMDRLHIRRGDRTAFLLALHGLEADRRLRRDSKGRYYRPAEVRPTAGRDVAQGELTSLHPHFGFVSLENGRGDCFIPGGELHGALPGDKVEIAMGRPDRKGQQGRILRIMAPGQHQYTGRLYEENRRLFVTPGGGFRYDLPVLRRSAIDRAEPGELVRFSVQVARSGEWMAVVERCYGSGDSARVCADALLDQYAIPTVFSEEALSEAEWRAAQPPDVHEEGREDLRGWRIFTIDGEDAKDLDDAVSLEKTDSGWLLGVHIADVSHYVVPGTPLDKEAFSRGTSVYFADRVIPMLPTALSNGACSLNAGEDKRALSALITLNEGGDIVDCRLAKSVIRSCVRGVYSEVNALFAGTASPAVQEKYTSVMEPLTTMRRLVSQMKRSAIDRGVMQLASVESRITLNERGEAEGIVPRAVGEAEGLIEHLMITANIAVATLARQEGLPFVYRAHEPPNTQRLGQVFDFARTKELPAPQSAEGVSQRQLQALLTAAGETPYARLISDLLLRSMAKARYDAEPVGHYGLALADYCHFTSPIRRYPDLMIHRILSRWLAGKSAESLRGRLGDVVKEAAWQSSVTEIRAMNAERACEACYKAEYMRRYLGESFCGMVVSLTGAGLFVELENTVCGLVPLEDLPESFLEYDGFMSLTDALGRPRYTVGQAVEVTVAACDVTAGRVRFAFDGFAEMPA
ncbi:MAG: VacB/RNase II family 3'-5' exoribonuclease [Clostridia bacterium]|nr:VacB/RNase II family 3'-5' exoribonuclease [Clostridia bacterium]